MSVRVQGLQVKGQGASASTNEISRIMEMPAAMALSIRTSYAWEKNRDRARVDRDRMDVGYKSLLS